MNSLCHGDRPNELMVGYGDHMIVSKPLFSTNDRGTVSFCRTCVILSQENQDVVIPSFRFLQPVSNKTT